MSSKHKHGAFVAPRAGDPRSNTSISNGLRVFPPTSTRLTGRSDHETNKSLSGCKSHSSEARPSHSSKHTSPSALPEKPTPISTEKARSTKKESGKRSEHRPRFLLGQIFDGSKHSTTSRECSSPNPPGKTYRRLRFAEKAEVVYFDEAKPPSHVLRFCRESILVQTAEGNLTESSVRSVLVRMSGQAKTYFERPVL